MDRRHLQGFEKDRVGNSADEVDAAPVGAVAHLRSQCCPERLAVAALAPVAYVIAADDDHLGTGIGCQDSW